MNWDHVTFVSAGAGSGKTYRLTEELERALASGAASPAGIIATTFTVKAADELRDRVRERLLRVGRLDLAERTAESKIGTVHGVCSALLRRHAFELGLSPELNVMSLDDGRRFFNQALDDVLSLDRVREMNRFAERLGLTDWQGTVKDIADKARENDVGPDALIAMGITNADDLLAFFPDVLESDPTDDLIHAVGHGVEALTDDGTKKTADYARTLRDAQARLTRVDCPWSEWMRLSGSDAAKANQSISNEIRAIASGFEAHPAFQADLHGFVAAVFRIAAESLRRFQAIKRSRGLIDFTDMEQLTLHALDHAAVKDRLAEELELLLVDEFQDTNPMQLALFVKMARLADKAIFVGDVKQAIYEFRGCDPTLVFDTLEALAQGDAVTDILQSSWRSTPPLVTYTNELFAEVFESELARSQIVLASERDEIDGPTVVSWPLSGGVDARAYALAAGVSMMVERGDEVEDPETGKRRPIRYGDIAVLARTNASVERIARALRDRRVPMKMTLQGLLETPEITLARACLRRLGDRADTLASAEILSLTDARDPEKWLADRLTWLETNPDPDGWAEADHPILGALASLREESAMRSPVEVVGRVINETALRRSVLAWGPDPVKAAQRQKNLDAFQTLAVEYEKHAASHHDAATLTGFLFWLEHPSSPDLDLQPVVTTGDAVHVLTYHRAKGLEWPVVVCADFDYKERLRTWDPRVELVDAFSIDDPLSSRAIRFFPNVYGLRQRGVPSRAAIESSDEGSECRMKSFAEQRRLAYVGITRARDRLVIGIAAKIPRDAWLGSFVTETLVPTGATLALGNGAEIETAVEMIDIDHATAHDVEFSPRWFKTREVADAIPEVVAPSHQPAAPNAYIRKMEELGGRVAIRGAEMVDLGNALHAVIAATVVNPLAKRAAVARARDLLIAHELVGVIDAPDAVAAADRFLDYLARFEPTTIQVEVPIQHRRDDGTLVQGFIDCLVETESGDIVVDHKSNPRPQSEWPDVAMAASGQLLTYCEALEAGGRTVRGAFVHFPVSGGMVEVAYR